MKLVNSNIMKRVFKISWGNSATTCFTIEQGNCQYLITAKHLFKATYPTKTQIGILKNNGQSDIVDVDVFYHTNQDIDIAIIRRIDGAKIGVFDFVNYNYQCYFSEDVFFLGYPHGIMMEYGSLGQTPLPLVKRAIISGFMQENNSNFMLLDGINNPGFSGGPVFAITDKQQIGIVGVISGYKSSVEKVSDSDGNDLDNGLYVKQNTGLIVAYNIEHAHEIIRTIPPCTL